MYIIKFIRNMQTIRESNSKNIVKEIFTIKNKKYGYLTEKTRLVITNRKNCPICKGLGHYIEKNPVLENLNNYEIKDCYLCTYIIN